MNESITSDDARPVVVAIGATELRRALGPTPWIVLEEMLRRSDGACTAQVSVRSLAAALGLSKDTVARAITRLRATGVVVAMQSRASSGAFDAGVYRIVVPSDVLPIAPVTTEQPSPARIDRRDTSQLSLAIGS
jgi:DNA-binding transcriptional MocR family regulator